MATDAPRETATPSLPRLTERQRSVLTLLTEGWSNKEIAVRLAISPAGVKRHVERLMSKYHVHRRTALVRAALDDGDLNSAEGCS